MDKTIQLKARYFGQIPEDDIPCREVELPIPLGASALALVDVSNIHHIKSFVEREQKVLTDGLLPVLNAARAARMTIIHAPSPRITRKIRLSPEDPAT